jgi:C4-dicarboxylate transporter
MSNPASSRPTETERELPSLPQVDTSRQAWAFVFASFLVETLLWGPLSSNGVFLKEYASLQTFATSSETKISLIGTLSLFLGCA